MSATLEAAEESGLLAPYPGLRPFEQPEHEIFFGRGEQIDQMLSSLEEKRFLAVVGSSGCGKSSLVRAGLLPAIADGYLTVPWEDEDREVAPWRFVLMRPGNAPFTRLAEAIQEAAREDPEEEIDPQAVAFTEATLRGGPNGFHDAITDAGLGGDVPVLLLVDQFEEIFRLDDREAEEGTTRKMHASVRDETVAFVNLMLSTAGRTEHFVPVILTMRSDWIGRCDAFEGLPEAVSGSQFLTPRMTRSQLREAIVGPLDLFDAEAEPALVNRILNEVGNEMDQLPLVQHALMRTWFAANKRWESSGAGRALTVADYEEVGGFSRALSKHVEEAWAELKGDEEDERIVRHMFLLLCEGRQGGGELTRRMATVQEVASVAETTPDDVARLVDVFRRDHRSFLVAPERGKMTEKTLLDISHEALLRQWERIQKWMKRESESADIYAEILKAAARREKGEASPWVQPELDVAVNWREKSRPTRAWAERYGGEYDAAMEFLSWSEELQEERARKEKEREEQEKERLALAAKNRRKGWIIKVGTVLLLGLSGLIGIMIYQGIRLAKAKRDSDSNFKMATENLNLANSRALAWKALGARSRDGELSMLLALDATLELNDNKSRILPSEIESALRLTVADAWMGVTFRGHAQRDSGEGGGRSDLVKVYSVDLDKSGKIAVSGSHGREGMTRVWETATGRELAVLDVDHNTVRCVKISPDGKKILTTTIEPETGHAYLWDGVLPEAEAEPGEVPAKPPRPKPFTSHPRGISAGAFHPTMPLIATGSYPLGPDAQEPEAREIQLWSYGSSTGGTGGESGGVAHLVRNEAGELLLDFRRLGVEPPEDLITSLTFRPTDGKRLLSTNYDGNVFIWNVDPESQPEDPGNSEESPAPAPDEAASTEPESTGGGLPGAENGNELADSEEAEDVPPVTWPEHIPPNVYRYEDGTLEIRAAHGGSSTSPERVWDGDYSPDGRLIATVGNDKRLRVWIAETGKLLASAEHSDSVLQVAFANNRQIAVTANDNNIHIWNLQWIPLDPHKAGSTSLNEDNAVLLLQQSDELTGHAGWIRGLSVRNGGALIASASEDGTARIWTPPPKAEVAWIEENGVSYWCAAVHSFEPPEGSGKKKQVVAFCGTSGGDVHAHDLFANKRVWESKFLKCHENKIRSVDVSRDGRFLATSSSGKGAAALWNIETGELVHRFEHTQIGSGENVTRGSTIYRVRFSEDGKRIVTAGADGSARIWDVSEMEAGEATTVNSINLILPRWDERGVKIDRTVYDAKFSPNGKWVATADFEQGTVTIWDSKDGTVYDKVTVGVHSVMSVGFSAGSREIAVASMDGNCYVYQVKKNRGSRRVLEHKAGARSLDYSPRADEKTLVTSASDGAVKLWTLPTYRPRSALRPYPKVITDVSFSTNGLYIVTSSRGGPVRVSYANVWSVYALAESRVTRKLTLEERAEFGVTRPLDAKVPPSGESEFDIYRKRVEAGMESESLWEKELQRVEAAKQAKNKL